LNCSMILWENWEKYFPARLIHHHHRDKLFFYTS
jgi:hypothetical protein